MKYDLIMLTENNNKNSHSDLSTFCIPKCLFGYKIYFLVWFKETRKINKIKTLRSKKQIENQGFLGSLSSSLTQENAVNQH